MKKLPLLFFLSLIGLLLFSACGNATVEETVDQVEQAVDEVAEGAGEEVQQAVDEVGEAVDAVVDEVNEQVDEATNAEEEMAEEEMADEEMADEEMADEEMADEEMTEHCPEDLTGETITIYQQAGREGPLAAILGDGFAFATEDVVEYINSNGGVCGASMEVVFGETNYDPELEFEVYEQFRAADPKPIVLLSYGSGATIALKDRVVEDQIVHFVAGLNAEALYNPADGYTIACCPIYSDQFAGFIQFLSENWADVKPEGAGDDIVVGVVGWASAFGAGATTPEAIAFAESLGVTVLPLEEQAVSPEADVTGQIQNLLLQGANVIYSQNLSFGTTQVIGTVRALGVWDQVVVGGVNWSMNTDVLSFLGENTAIANGYYGVFPYLWWNDTDVEIVQIANDIFNEKGYDESARAVTYLTTFASFFAIRDAMEHAITLNGYENLNGETLLAAMQDLGTIDAGGVFTINVEGSDRAPRTAQIRQWQWNGESMDYVVIEDFFELPDTRPGASE